MLFMGQVKQSERCLLGFHFVDFYRMWCFLSSKFGFGHMPLREITTIRGGSRTFVTHLRALVENVTHFLNHCPFPKIFLKLQCQEVLGFFKQLICSVLDMGCGHVSHC